MEELDLMFRMEKAFGAKVPRGRRSPFPRRVRDVGDFMCTLVALAPEEPVCASFSHFWAIRERLASFPDVAGRNVTPDLALEPILCGSRWQQFLQHYRRERTWSRLAGHLGMNLPTFVDYGSMVLVFIFLFPVNCILLPLVFGEFWLCGVGFFLAILETMVIALIVQPLLPRRIPGHFKTVTDLVALRMLDGVGSSRPWTRGAVHLRVRQILAEMTGRSIREIRPNLTLEEVWEEAARSRRES